jgi:hypothetical protein
MNYIEQLFMLWGKQANNYGNILDVTIHDYQISVSPTLFQVFQSGFQGFNFPVIDWNMQTQKSWG